MNDYQLTIKKNQQIAQGVFEMVLTSKIPLPKIRAGQFLHIETPGKTLRRPFCIADISARSVTFAYAVVGGGTEILSGLKAGTALSAALPLGNGFPQKAYKRILLVGGGLGCLPLLPLLKQKGFALGAVLGFSSGDKTVYTDKYIDRCDFVVLRTDDGSAGEKGFPTDNLKEIAANFKADAVFACGPERMFAALKKEGLNIPVFVSVETRMGCGTGACLVCTCRIKKDGEYGHLRVCADGPVFRLCDMELR